MAMAKKSCYHMLRRNLAGMAKNFCVLHNEVEHNYISSSITIGLQLHVSALYVGHLQVDLTVGAAIQDVRGVLLG